MIFVRQRESYRLIDRRTDYRQIESTEIRNHAASWVVNNYNSYYRPTNLLRKSRCRHKNFVVLVKAVHVHYRKK